MMTPISLPEYEGARGKPAALVALANRQRLKLHEAPSQSLFRVVALFYISFGPSASRQQGVVEGYNAEQSYIGGAICAERAALTQLRKYEEPEIHEVVITTDSREAISPGILCREYLTTSAQPETVIILGNSDGSILSDFKLREIHPFPYLYRTYTREQMASAGEAFGLKCRQCKLNKDKNNGSNNNDNTGWSEEERALYDAALAAVDTSPRTLTLHPISFGAAVRFADNTVEASGYLPALEYGASVCPVQLLCRELDKRVRANGPLPIIIVQVDQFGTAHCPFASARTLLNEHFDRDLKVLYHDENALERSCFSAELCPPPPGPGASFLTHDAFLGT